MSDPSFDPSFDPGAAGPIDPYASPRASITPAAGEDLADAEQTRRQLIKHETSIRSIGTLYYVGAFFMGLAGISAIAAILAVPEAASPDGIVTWVGLLYALLAVVSFYLGRGLRRLEPKVRTGVTLLSVLGLIGFPLGTLINGYILYLLHCAKGRRVMTGEYQAIIAQTPHIRYRTPVWLILLAVLIVAFVVFALFTSFSG